MIIIAHLPPHNRRQSTFVTMGQWGVTNGHGGLVPQVHAVLPHEGLTFPSLLDGMAVNLFRGTTNPKPVQVLSLAEVLDGIHDSTYQRPVQWLRALLQAGNKAAYDRAKRRLDAVTFGGTFGPTRAKANLTLHSGIVHGDLDHLAALEAAKRTLTSDPCSDVRYRNYIRGQRALGGRPSITRLPEQTENAPAHILDQLESHASYITSLYTQCINGLQEGRIAGEGLEGVGFIGQEEVAEVILVGIEIGEWRPGHVVLQITPDPLNGVQCWAIGRQEHEAHVRREDEPLGRMSPTVVQQEDLQAVGEGLCEGVDEELAHLGVQRGPLQKAPVTRGGLHRAIDVAPREDMLDGPKRLHATGGEAPPSNGQEAEAAFVVAKAPDGAGVRRWDHLLELGLTGGLERRNGLRVFWCDWAGPL